MIMGLDTFIAKQRNRTFMSVGRLNIQSQRTFIDQIKILILIFIIAQSTYAQMYEVLILSMTLMNYWSTFRDQVLNN